MLCAGCTWAFIIGNACSVFANMDHHGSAWRTDMDELNYFMEDMEIDEALRVRVRMYFLKGRDLQRHRDYITLVAKMSPGLKGEVSQQLNKHNLNAIWFLKKVASRTAGCYMAEAFTHAMFPPWEWVKEDALHVIETGMVLCNGIPKRRGKIWGYDIILDCQDLRRDQAVRSLTYTEVNYVNKEALQLTCEQHPEVRTTPYPPSPCLSQFVFFCAQRCHLHLLLFAHNICSLTQSNTHTHTHTAPPLSDCIPSATSCDTVGVCPWRHPPREDCDDHEKPKERVAGRGETRRPTPNSTRKVDDVRARETRLEVFYTVEHGYAARGGDKFILDLQRDKFHQHTTICVLPTRQSHSPRGGLRDDCW